MWHKGNGILGQCNGFLHDQLHNTTKNPKEPPPLPLLPKLGTKMSSKNATVMVLKPLSGRAPVPSWQHLPE